MAFFVNPPLAGPQVSGSSRDGSDLLFEGDRLGQHTENSILGDRSHVEGADRGRVARRRHENGPPSGSIL